MASQTTFADLMTDGIYAIQRNESHQKKKLVKEIVEELGHAIGRQASAVEYFRKGNTPTNMAELEQLARELFRRGEMDREWLEAFLVAGGHPRPSVICDELFIPDTQTVDDQALYLYRRKVWSIRRTYLADRTVVQVNRVELQVMSELGLDSVRHRNIAEVPGECAGLQLEFEAGRRDGEGTMRNRVLRHNDDILVWTVEFDPPLEKLQSAFYQYRQTYPKQEPWTYEECENLYSSGIYQRKFAFYRITAQTPTDVLNISIVFPPGYPISLPSTGGFGVYAGLAEDLHEKTKLIAQNAFSAAYDKERDQWTLSLSASQARAGVGYELHWIPPREERLVAN